MAKVNAPLLSFGGSGQIAQSHVYSSWRGVRYARRYVVPGNPQSTEQMKTRNAFAGLNDIYKLAGPLLTATWDAYASGKPLTGRNGFIKANLSNIRGETDLLAFTFSSGAKGGLPPSSVSPAAGSNQIAVTIVPPTAPTGWTVASCIAAVVRDQDPAATPYPTSTEGEDATDPYVITLSGLTASVLYIVGGWIKWTKPDGTTAYSAALMSSATPTV